MKILLINDYATPTGGAEISTLTLRSLLRQKGHDVRLFASSAQNNSSHVLLIGQTGSGKTTLARWLIGQLILYKVIN